jgi:hypothetical protein
MKLYKIILTVGFFIFSVPAALNAQKIGVEVWTQNCGNCHSIQPAARYTAENWSSLIIHMRITARLTDEESSAVAEFLKEGSKKPIAASLLKIEPANPERSVSRKANHQNGNNGYKLKEEEVKALMVFLHNL